MSKGCDPNGWRQCPLGTVAQMVGRIRAGERREFLRTVAKGSAAVVLLASGGLVASQWMGGRQAKALEPLTCRECKDLLPEYAAHHLDADLTERVTVHLAKCPPCNKRYLKMVG